MIEKIDDRKRILIYQLFVGKVSNEIGIDKALELMKESKEAILKAYNED